MLNLRLLISIISSSVSVLAIKIKPSVKRHFRLCLIIEGAGLQEQAPPPEARKHPKTFLLFPCVGCLSCRAVTWNSLARRHVCTLIFGVV